MKKTATLIICLFLLSCSAQPPASQAEPPVQPTLDVQPAPPPVVPAVVQESTLVVRGPKLVEGKKIFAISIEDGKGRSQYATRTDDKLTLELGVGDVVRFAIPYGKAEVTLSGALRQQLKPGDTIYVEPTSPGTNSIFVSVGQEKIDRIELVASKPKEDVDAQVEVSSSTAQTLLTTPVTIKVFDIIAKSWVFEPATIDVQQGDNVLLSFTSKDDDHGIGIAEYNINVKIPAGRQANVSFVANKQGTFPLYCTVYCGKGHRDMRGLLVVK